MTTTPSGTRRRFDVAALRDLDEPVRRYFLHALTDGAPLARGARLRLRGHIKVGAWLRFDSVWEGDGRSFSWQATYGPPRLPLLPCTTSSPMASGSWTSGCACRCGAFRR
jgi:hypothetical protein